MSAEDQVEKSNRGFLNFPEIPSSYGGGVRLVQSSAVDPHVWLFTSCPEDLNTQTGCKEVELHLTVDNAKLLIEQLQYLIDNHPNVD